MIADKLKKARIDQGLSQTELGKKAGVSHIQINRYEKASTKPSGKILKKLADALDVDSGYFFEDDDVENAEMSEIDCLYKELRVLIADDLSERIMIKRLFEAVVYKNETRHKFS